MSEISISISDPYVLLVIDGRSTILEPDEATDLAEKLDAAASLIVGLD